MPATMDVVLKTLRSILNTTKNGLFETQLQDIYREMEGRDIPYKEFHFNTLSDFFNASNEFHLSKSHGGYMYIRARPKEHSKHIVNMVSEQRMKNTKSRKPRPYQITNLAGYQSQKQRHLKWNTVLKAKIKAANRKNLKRKIGQKRKMNGNQVQTNNRNDSILTARSSTDNVHFWLHSFFKQVQFLLKQIAANAILYDENHMDCFKEAMKICVWKEIAHDYRGLCILDNLSEEAEHTKNGLSLKYRQKSVQSQLDAFLKDMRHRSKYGHSGRLNNSEISCAMDSPEQAEITEHGLVDFMQNVAFILECIVANPILYEHKHQLHRNESAKFSIWNHICNVYYEKIQNNDYELSDEDVHFEIKHLQRTIERHLNRLTKPLTFPTVAQ